MTAGPLAGVEVVTIAVNLPGPVAAARLADLGARVVKVEPPAGDPLAQYTPEAYAELSAGQEVVRLDLKTETGTDGLHALLATADVLLTSHRPSALARLGLSWDDLHARHPRLIQVAVVGHPGPGTEVPGHDLTYQAVHGLVDGLGLPRVLLADLAGGDRAALGAVAALVGRSRSGRDATSRWPSATRPATWRGPTAGG